MNKKLTPFWTLFILTGLNLFNYLDRSVLAAVRTPLQKELNLSDGDTGRVATAFMIGYFVTSPFFGYLGDRLPRKWLIAFGIFVWSLGTVLTGFAGGFAMLLFFRKSSSACRDRSRRCSYRSMSRWVDASALPIELCFCCFLNSMNSCAQAVANFWA